MKSKILSVAIYCTLLFPVIIKAQNETDALRYSMLNYGSTARSLGMGNSFGALGADFSSLSMNPAGIGLYRRSEVTLSPLFSNRTIDNDYLGNNESSNYFKFSFGNFGAVFAGENTKPTSHFKTWGFGIGYNKTNDFSGRSIAKGSNPSNSLVDHFLEKLDGVYPEDIPSYFPYDVDLAWQTFLIDTITDDGQLYYYNNSTPYAGQLQRKSVTTKGGQGEWDFSLGTNIDNKLFLGFTFGLATINYEENSTWEESDDQDTIPYFRSFSYFQHLKTSGNGINFKLGAIYKPSDVVRFGVAVHSPTWYRLTDTYSADIRTDLENTQIYTYRGPEYLPFNYNLTTPFRAIGSIAIIAGGQFAINADYEYVNYKHARMRAEENQFDSYFSEVNDSVRSKFTSAHNVRLGAEYRYDNLRFRAGGQFSPTPFKNNISSDTDLSRIGLSAGFGIKQEHFFIDFGYAYSRYGYSSIPYTLSQQEVQSIVTKVQDHKFLVTLGLSF